MDDLSLLVYLSTRYNISKKIEKFGFKLAILLNFEIIATQPDFVAYSIALKLDIFIVNLFLKLLCIVKFFLANSYQFLEFKK